MQRIPNFGDRDHTSHTLLANWMSGTGFHFEGVGARIIAEVAPTVHENVHRVVGVHVDENELGLVGADLVIGFQTRGGGDVARRGGVEQRVELRLQRHQVEIGCGGGEGPHMIVRQEPQSHVLVGAGVVGEAVICCGSRRVFGRLKGQWSHGERGGTRTTERLALSGVFRGACVA